MNVWPDAMENLAFPPKIYQAAEVALDEARAAGKRFLAAKFDVQERGLSLAFLGCMYLKSDGTYGFALTPIRFFPSDSVRWIAKLCK